MTPQTKNAIARLFADAAVIDAVAELRAECAKNATSKARDEASRQEALYMLWALDALVKKVQANKEHATKESPVDDR